MYRYHLLLRLVLRQGRWVDDDREETAFGMFAAQCGQRRARKLRLLLYDVRASAALACGAGTGGGGGKVKHDRWPSGFNMIVVSEDVWPLQAKPRKCLYPRSACVAFRRFRELYATAYGGRRKLTLMPQMCTAEVLATCRGRATRFTVTMYQVTVLLLFNGRVDATHADLADETGIPEPEMSRTLESLVNNRWLTNEGHVYRLHRDYVAPDEEAWRDKCYLVSSRPCS